MKKLFLRFERNGSGFTLIEVLVSISMFSIVVVFASGILADMVNLEKKTALLNDIYEDSRIILQQLSREIQGGTLDYEEYYNINIIQALQSPSANSFNPTAQPGVQMPDGGPYYGINYGAYSSRFFDPGKSLDGFPTTNPEDLGIECSFPDDIQQDGDCEVYYTYSSDFNTGQNPYKKSGSDAASGDAFCDNQIGRCEVNKNTVDELYLIDSSGSKKTIIARRKMQGDDWAIGIVKMEGKDLDQNGFIDLFGCSEEFKCFQQDASGSPKMYDFVKYPFVEMQGASEGQTFLKDNKISIPKMSDRFQSFDINTSHFIPISPKRSTIKSLKFIINPVEDPYKAYDEQLIQQHPSVSIILTLGLASDVAADYPGEFQDLTVQTTVTAGVIGGLDSYPPADDVLSNSNNTSWISKVLPDGVNK